MSFIFRNNRLKEINFWGSFKGNYEDIDMDYNKELLENYGEVIEYKNEYRILDIPHNAIFNDLNSDVLGSAYKEKIKWALITSLGERVNVYTQDGDANTVMNIRLFTDNLILKQMLFNKVLNVIMDSSGTITGIVVELWNYPAVVTDSAR